MTSRGTFKVSTKSMALALALSSAMVVAAAQPQNILPSASPAPAPTASASPVPVAVPTTAPVIIAQLPIDEPVVSWTLNDAKALLGVIEGIDADGLIPADYQPDALRTAIGTGPGLALDAQASRSFACVFWFL